MTDFGSCKEIGPLVSSLWVSNHNFCWGKVMCFFYFCCTSRDLCCIHVITV